MADVNVEVVPTLIVDDSATAIYCVSHSFSLGESALTSQNAKPPSLAQLGVRNSKEDKRDVSILMKLTRYKKAEMQKSSHATLM